MVVCLLCFVCCVWVDGWCFDLWLGCFCLLIFVVVCGFVWVLLVDWVDLFLLFYEFCLLLVCCWWFGLWVLLLGCCYVLDCLFCLFWCVLLRCWVVVLGVCLFGLRLWFVLVLGFGWLFGWLVGFEVLF